MIIFYSISLIFIGLLNNVELSIPNFNVNDPIFDFNCCDGGGTGTVPAPIPQTTTQAPNTQAPITQAPNTQAPNTQAPNTQAPNTQAPNTQAPNTQAPTQTEPPIDPTVPSNRPIRFGTYIPSWFVYNKHYMGLSKLNVNGTPMDPYQASSQWTYWAQQLRPHASKLSSIYYTFWDVDSNCIVRDVDSDASWYGAAARPTWIRVPNGSCEGLMNDMMSLKHQFPHLKLMVSLGGWTYSANFSKCAADASMRERIANTLNFLLKQMDPDWGKPGSIWDGVDLDWEFPEASGDTNNFTTSDWDNYLLLVKAIRDMANREGRNQAVVSSAVGVGQTLVRLAAKPNVAKDFCDSLDYINLMTYDIHGKWDPTTGHNAAFCADKRSGNPIELNVVEVVDRIINAGCDPAKINLGIPNYSHAWSNIEAGPHGNGLFSTASNQSFWTGWSTFSDSDNSLVPQGILSYWDVADSLLNNPDIVTHVHMCPENRDVAVPIKHLYSSSRKIFASYEDPETVRHKAMWANVRGLGGIFFWDVQQDKNAVLLDAAREGFGVTNVELARNAHMCFDNRKLNYDLDPLTGNPIERLCQFTNHSLVFNAGDTCNALRQRAVTLCGNHEPTVIGGHRQGATECLSICGPSFGAGAVGPWVGDVIFYACANETIPPASEGTPGGGAGGAGGARDCRQCATCVAIPGNPQAANNNHCSPCALGGQTWWPCDVPGLCQCG